MMSLHMKVSRLAMELEDKVFGKRTRDSDKLARQVEEMDHLLSTSQPRNLARLFTPSVTRLPS